MGGQTMVVIDATMLLLFLVPDVPGPTDARGRPLSYASQRVRHLVTQLDDRPGEIIAIPTPVLSEVLIRRSPLETRKIVDLLNGRGVFSIEPFDQRAAIELAQMLKKRPRKGPETWAKLKFDCQIVAIAKACGATQIYSDDEDVYKLGAAASIPVLRTRDLELPPEAGQAELFPDGEDDSSGPEPGASIRVEGYGREDNEA